MKNNYLKTLAVILIGIVSFSITTDVSAKTEKTVTGKFTVHNKVVSIKNSGLLGTHIMTFDPEGSEETQSAYCVWWEKDPPDISGEYTFNLAQFDNPKNAVGVAYILNHDITSKLKKCGTDTTDDTERNHHARVVKTTALNLYLSLKKEKMGLDGTDFNRFNGKKSDPGYAVNEYGYNAQEGNLTGMLAFFNSEDKFEGKDDDNPCYRKIVADLYYAASAQQNIDYDALEFETNNADFELKNNGYYEKTYKLKDNNQTIKSINATVTGIDTTNVTITKDIVNKKVTIRIPQSVMNKVTDKSVIKVIADAEYKIPVANIYYAGDDRSVQQDIIFAKTSLEPYKVSTDDKISYKTCYRYVTTCDSTACDNYGKNNDRTCSGTIESYPSRNCSSDDIDVKASGKKTADLIAGTCSLYCTEESTVSYPGNVRPAVNMYTHFSWPTPGTDSKYSLYTESKLTCTIEMNNGGAVTKACINKAKGVEYKNGPDTATLSYNDTKTNNEIKLKQSCETKTSFNEDTQKIEINNKCSYALPSNKNIGVSKKTIGFVDDVKVSETDNTINSILINKYHGVLPIGGIKGYINFNDTKAANLFKQKYDLQINNMPLGYLGQFTEQVNSNQYVCKYQITDKALVGCKCPPGTKHVGRDVTDKIENINNTTKTCAEAIEIYCNSDKEEYCYKDGEKVPITDCLNQGNTRAFCDSDLCGITPPPLVCPPGSDQAGEEYWPCGLETKEACKNAICYAKCDDENCKCPPGTYYEGKDIENCIYIEMAEGKKFDDAKKTCVEKECNEGVSDKIIYRTISLENPFPGKNANGKVDGFNDDVKGRYPGANWNSTVLVYNKILNNRGYDGSAIYQEADPLYVIELDATAIKKIRKYNKAQVKSGGYADFTLNCTDGAYCRSNFLRNIGENINIKKADGTAILTGGTCQFVDGKEDFVNCYWYKTKKG